MAGMRTFEVEFRGRVTVKAPSAEAALSIVETATLSNGAEANIIADYVDELK